LRRATLGQSRRTWHSQGLGQLSTIPGDLSTPQFPALDPKLLSVTEEGHLLFQNFQAADSGNYSCTISYTEHGLPVSQTFHYRVLGESYAKKQEGNPVRAGGVEEPWGERRELSSLVERAPS